MGSSKSITGGKEPRSPFDQMAMSTMVATVGVLSALIEELLASESVDAQSLGRRLEALLLRENAGEMVAEDHYRGLIQTFINQVLSHGHRAK